MRKSKAPIYVIGITFSAAILLAIQFYPEWFEVSDTMRMVLKIVLAADMMILIFLLDREKKKRNDDLNN